MVKTRYLIFIAIIVFTIFTIMIFNNITYANSNTIKIASSGDILENLDEFRPSNPVQEPKFTQKVGTILGILNVVGMIIMIITLMIIGLKYMFGSVEEKANYKKTMIPWIIGAVLVFTVSTIPNILYHFGKSFEEEDVVGGRSTMAIYTPSRILGKDTTML